MSRAAELAYADPEVPAGAVVGVVEIIDADMTTVARSIIRADVPVAVYLPLDGRYVAHGRLSDGARLTATFTVGPGAGPAVAVLNREPTTTGEGTDTSLPQALQSGDGWLLAWRHEAGRWSPATTPKPRPIGHASILVPTTGPTHPYEPVAVQIGGDGSPPRITLVPAGTPLRLVQSGTGQEPSLGTDLLPGLGATLLGYLHRGDSASARVAAEAALAEYPQPGRPGNGLLDLAVGYFLVRTFHDQALPWVRQLRGIQPESTDVAVLDAWLRLQGRWPSRPEAGEAFARAASSGLPVVADGLRLLVDGLSLLADSSELAEQHRRLRVYLTECLPSPITSFVGTDPMSPGVVPAESAAPSSMAVRLPEIARSMTKEDPARYASTLVQRAQAGEAEAFATICDRYADTVFRFAYFRVGNRQLAEDLTSDTFLRAVPRIGTFTWQGRDLGAWLVRIARDLVADHFKSGRYRLEITTGDVLDADREDRGPGSGREGGAVHHIAKDSLLTAVTQLNPEQQECIVLRFLQGFSVAETARIMGRNEGAITALQYRAARRLAGWLPHERQRRETGASTAGRVWWLGLLDRRRAELFAELIDGSSAGHDHAGHDASMTPLVSVGRLLREAAPGVALDGDFRRGLRAFIKTTVARDGMAATATAAPAAVSPAAGPAVARLLRSMEKRRLRARGAIVIGVASGAMAVSGISAASEDAVPGDALYGVKRSTERAQLAMAGSDVTRGQLSLAFAANRLAEAAALDGDDPGVGAVLGDMDDDTAQGVRLLTSAAATRNDPAPLAVIDDFVATQRRVLVPLRDRSSGPARIEVEASLTRLDEIQRRSTALRPVLGCGGSVFGAADRYGPTPTRKKC